MRAWVLSGGGVRGAFQVGLMKRLLENKLFPDIVCGVSVGALNGFFAAQHKIEELEEFWREITDIEDVFRKRWFAGPLMLVGWQWGYPSIYKPGKLGTVIKKTVKKMQKGDFKAELRVGTVDLISGELRVVNQTHPCLASFISASMAVPLAFPPVRIKDKEIGGIYVDGCVRNMTPLKEVINAGADEVHIMLTNRTRLQPSNVKYKQYEQIIGRTVDISLHEILIQDIKSTLLRNNIEGYKKVKLFVYEPQADVQLPGLLDFTEKGIADCIEYGGYAYPSLLENKDLTELLFDRHKKPYSSASDRLDAIMTDLETTLDCWGETAKHKLEILIQKNITQFSFHDMAEFAELGLLTASKFPHWDFNLLSDDDRKIYENLLKTSEKLEYEDKIKLEQSKKESEATEKECDKAFKELEELLSKRNHLYLTSHYNKDDKVASRLFLPTMTLQAVCSLLEFENHGFDFNEIYIPKEEFEAIYHLFNTDVNYSKIIDRFKENDEVDFKHFNLDTCYLSVEVALPENYYQFYLAYYLKDNEELVDRIPLPSMTKEKACDLLEMNISEFYAIEFRSESEFEIVDDIFETDNALMDALIFDRLTKDYNIDFTKIDPIDSVYFAIEVKNPKFNKQSDSEEMVDNSSGCGPWGANT